MARKAQLRIVALGCLCGCSISVPSAADQGGEIKIDLLMVNEAAVPQDVVTLAKAETARIYQVLGIVLVWSEAADGAIGGGLVVKIVPRALAGKGIRSDALGVALGSEERRGRVAYAFYDRIQRVTNVTGADSALILGHVIAHEMGHLLLPSGAHAMTGLMRGRWDTEQVMRATRGALTFTAREAALIPQRLRTISSREIASGACVVKCPDVCAVRIPTSCGWRTQ